MTFNELPSISEAEVAMAIQLMQTLQNDWHPAKYKDTYAANLRGLIEAAKLGNEFRMPPPKTAASAQVDIMAAMAQSITDAKKKRKEQVA
jgi:DNA end-binding protein Ku